MNRERIINKIFFTKQGKKCEISIECNGFSFTTKIVINNIMVCENITFTMLLDGDEIEPHIENIDKINTINNKMVELTELIKHLNK